MRLGPGYSESTTILTRNDTDKSLSLTSTFQAYENSENYFFKKANRNTKEIFFIILNDTL